MKKQTCDLHACIVQNSTKWGDFSVVLSLSGIYFLLDTKDKLNFSYAFLPALEYAGISRILR